MEDNYQDETPEYKAFVEKFKPKKTTDDCYTPPLIYETVKNWACKEYGIDPEKIVRPFYPGGDYEHYDYPEGCTVLDNPPFSILTKIIAFYLERGIAFFLFAPTMTAFSGRNVAFRCNHIFGGADIEYENGAIVPTSFVTSYGGDLIVQTAPELKKALKEAVRKKREEKTKTMPKYAYPDQVLTAAMLDRYAKYGINMKVSRKECLLISKLDEQKKVGKSIYGSGLLLSDQKAAEKAAAEKAAAIRWKLSDRELGMVASLRP